MIKSSIQPHKKHRINIILTTFRFSESYLNFLKNINPRISYTHAKAQFYPSNLTGNQVRNFSPIFVIFCFHLVDWIFATFKWVIHTTEVNPNINQRKITHPPKNHPFHTTHTHPQHIDSTFLHFNFHWYVLYFFIRKKTGK